MLNHIPEIEDFFTRDSFSDVELQTLFESVNSMYKNHSEKKQALALIKLKLLAFKMRKNEAPKENVQFAQVNKQEFSKNSDIQKRDQKIEVALTRIKGKNIIELSNLINNTLPQTQIWLSKLKIDLPISMKIDETIFKLLEPHLKKKLENQLDFKLKDKKDQLKLKQRSQNKNQSVYNEISKFGLGKVVYIRKQN